jgi:hypothetical protein
MGGTLTHFALPAVLMVAGEKPIMLPLNKGLKKVGEFLSLLTDWSVGNIIYKGQKHFNLI